MGGAGEKIVNLQLGVAYISAAGVTFLQLIAVHIRRRRRYKQEPKEDEQDEEIIEVFDEHAFGSSEES